MAIFNCYVSSPEGSSNHMSSFTKQQLDSTDFKTYCCGQAIQHQQVPLQHVCAYASCVQERGLIHAYLSLSTYSSTWPCSLSSSIPDWSRCATICSDNLCLALDRGFARTLKPCRLTRRSFGHKAACPKYTWWSFAVTWQTVAYEIILKAAFSRCLFAFYWNMIVLLRQGTFGEAFQQLLCTDPTKSDSLPSASLDIGCCPWLALSRNKDRQLFFHDS